MDLSIVLPAYNEGKRLPPTLVRLSEYLKNRESIEFEVIVVDDGSTDNTAEVVEKSKSLFSNLKLIQLTQNSGKGCAVRSGILEARGNKVLFADADGSTPFEELERLEQALLSGSELAIGSRAAPSEEINIETVWYRKFIGRVFNCYISLVVLPGFFDTQCGFKLFTKKCAKFIFSHQKANGFSFDIEVLTIARRAGIKITEVPVNWVNVPGSKVNLVVDAMKMFVDSIKFRIKHRNITPDMYQNTP